MKNSKKLTKRYKLPADIIEVDELLSPAILPQFESIFINDGSGNGHFIDSTGKIDYVYFR